MHIGLEMVNENTRTFGISAQQWNTEDISGILMSLNSVLLGVALYVESRTLC